MKLKKLLTIFTAATLMFAVSPVATFAAGEEALTAIGAEEEELTELSEEETTDLSVDSVSEDKEESLRLGSTDATETAETEATASKTSRPKGLATLLIPRNDVPIVGAEIGSTEAGQLPAKWDSFAEKKLTPVRDQGNTGTCWAHSTMGAMEADLVTDGYNPSTVDLSEMHLAYHMYNTYTDPKGCRKDTVELIGKDDYLNEGGDTELAANLLSNLVGAAHEDDFPLKEDPDDFDADTKYVVGFDVAQIRNAYFINFKDRDGIKAAVMAHGGVTADIMFDDAKYGDATNKSYYSNKAGTDHAVMIVGWDDNFSKDKFNSKSGAKPANNGAWLMRNSYGVNDYSLDGYFWMSYEDVSFNKRDYGLCVAYDVSTDTFDNCYAYDGSTYPTDIVKVGMDDTVAVSYTVGKGEAVKGVGVALNSENATIYATAMNMATGQYVQGDVHTSYAGIYTVEFKKPLEVYTKSEVVVYLNLISDKGNAVKLCAETPGENEPLKDVITTAKVDKGFYLNNKKIKKDPRVKLYTNKSDAKPVKVRSVSLNKKSASFAKGQSITLKANIKPANASNILVTWKSSDKSVATVNDCGVVKGKKVGKAKITVTTKDGKKTASCNITVKKPVKVTGVKLNPTKKNVTVGKTFKITATVKPKNATNKAVTWKSSNKKVATVDKNGKVKALKKGTVTITATSKDNKKKATCKVTVK